MLDYGGVADGRTMADRLDTRFQVLLDERRALDPLHRAISKLTAPRRGRWSDDQGKHLSAEHAYRHIFNEAGIYARRILSAGLMSGITSPSRPWFELDFEDRNLADFHEHKAWLRQLRDRMLTVFRVSNIYGALYSIYNEMGPFGNGCAVLDFHFDNVIHMHTLTAGRFVWWADDYNQVVGMMREMQMTVWQIYDAFYERAGGSERFPRAVKDAYDKGRYEVQFPVRQVIQPRREWDKSALGAKRFPVQSAYWFTERDAVAEARDDGLLLDTGYQESALIGARWDTVDNEVYAVSYPGEEALGVLRQAQHMEKSFGVALEQMVRPTTLLPATLRKHGAVPAPGAILWTESREQADGARSLYKDPPRVQEFMQERGIIQERIYQAFYADVVTAISAARRASNREMTATEVAEIVGEKLLMLGPVLERMQVELIEPTIERTFAIMLRANLVPPAPERIRGERIKVNHISTLAQAQRAVATGSVDRSMMLTERMFALDQSVLDVLKRDDIVRDYWQRQGADPSQLATPEEVAKMREARQAELQQMKAMQAAEAGSKAVSNMAVPTQGGESNMVADLAGL